MLSICRNIYENTIQGWYKVNKDFLTPGQNLNMLVGVSAMPKRKPQSIQLMTSLWPPKMTMTILTMTDKVLEDNDCLFLIN